MTSVTQAKAKRPSQPKTGGSGVLQGTVDSYYEDRGYGFVTGDDQVSYYVFWRAIETETPGQPLALFAGQRVQFRRGQNEKGKLALNVRPLADAAGGMDALHEGVVTQWDAARAWGLIECDTLAEPIFAHRCVVAVAGVARLQAGDRVLFAYRRSARRAQSDEAGLEHGRGAAYEATRIVPTGPVQARLDADNAAFAQAQTQTQSTNYREKILHPHAHRKR